MFYYYIFIEYRIIISDLLETIFLMSNALVDVKFYKVTKVCVSMIMLIMFNHHISITHKTRLSNSLLKTLFISNALGSDKLSKAL